MKAWIPILIACFAPGCTEDGIVPGVMGCPAGFDLVGDECLPSCDPPCGPGETCNRETGTCEEAPAGDGSTDSDAPSGPDGADAPGDGDAPGDAVDGGDPGTGDPPGDGSTDTSTGDTTGDGSCDPPNMMCGSACINPMNNPLHCGGCGLACPLGASCVAGTCACTIPGQMVCDGACIDILGDPANCGGCGVTCDESGPSCVSGECRCGPDPACAPCDPTSCGTCETCCPREGCMAMDESNCGACGTSCYPLDQCGPYEVSGTCTFVCEEAFDPSRHYDGLFDITPYTSTECSGSPSHDIRRLHFMVMGGNLRVRSHPFILEQSPVSTTADFVVTGTSGCMTVTLTGHFRNADVFTGTWESVPSPSCRGCLGETLLITGTRH